MAVTPLYQLGRHLTSVIITGLTVGTAGAITDSTAVTVTPVINGLDLSYSSSKEQISPLNSTRQHNVILDDGFSYNIAVLKVNNGSDPLPLRTVFSAFDYFKVVFVEGTGGSAKTTTGYTSRNSLQTNFQGKGQQIASLTLDSIDAGTAFIATT